MIYLDKITKNVLLEEGQTLVSLEDMEITNDDLNDLFFSIYEQARPYAQRYLKKKMHLSTSPVILDDAVEIKRITYDIYPNMYNRMATDIAQSAWEFNPHTRQLQVFAGTNYVVDYLCYPKCDYLPISEVHGIADNKLKFVLPCLPDDDFKLKSGDYEATVDETNTDTSKIVLNGTLGSGEIDLSSLKLTLDTTQSGLSDGTSVDCSFTTKNRAIEEWDMKTEIFVVWFKAALLNMIGSIKAQAGNIDSAAMPFDVTRDDLLQKAQNLYSRVEELKINKSNWWEF